MPHAEQQHSARFFERIRVVGFDIRFEGRLNRAARPVLANALP
jgi:hypothetical protein